MAQQNNRFTAFWMDATTAPGTPLTGLSATINIRDVNGNLVVNSQPMTDIGGGHYVYTFAAYNPAVDYVYDCNPGATAYIESGVTNNIQQLISEIRVGNGGAGISSQAIKTSISNNMKEIERKIEEEHSKTRDLINTGNSDSYTQKESIISGISSIESKVSQIPDVKKGLSDIKKQNAKVVAYVESEKDEKEKEMEDMKKSHETEMADVMESADEIIDMIEEENRLLKSGNTDTIKTLPN